MIVDNAKTLDCFDMARTSNNFFIKVYGIKICFQNPNSKKSIIVKCILDEAIVQFISNSISIPLGNSWWHIYVNTTLVF